MRADRIGLTKLYNRFHTDTERDPRIEELRSLQRQMDAAVAHAYGWDDLDLNHGFHEVPYLPESDRIRFTISETARIEVLQRLSELNRQRYEEEVAQGLHSGSTKRPSPRTPHTSQPVSATPVQAGLDFDTAPMPTVNGTIPATKILGFLGANQGWHAKSEILATTGIPTAQWNAAIASLIAEGKVERQEKNVVRATVRLARPLEVARRTEKTGPESIRKNLRVEHGRKKHTEERKAWVVVDRGLERDARLKDKGVRLKGRHPALREGAWVLVLATDGRIQRIGQVLRIRIDVDSTALYFDKARTIEQQVSIGATGLVPPSTGSIVPAPWTEFAEAIPRALGITLADVPTIEDEAYIRELLQLAIMDDLLGPAGGPRSSSST